MGDRAVAGFREKSAKPEQTIYIYQHWCGGNQEQSLAHALEKARGRWNDPSYATRICISQLVGEYWNDETGYGLYVGDTKHGADYFHILVVDWEAQKVLVCDNDDSNTIIDEFTFEEFIENPNVMVANATMTFNQEKDAELMKRLGLDNLATTSL